MDQNNQNPIQSSQPAQPQPGNDITSLIPAAQTQALFEELHLQNLPADKKEEMLNTMIDTVMDRIFLRIEPELSEEAKKKLDELETNSAPEQEIIQLLVSSVPNLDAIAQEEINKYKEELKLQINTIIQTFDEEASKVSQGNVVTNPFEGVVAQPVPQPAPAINPQPSSVTPLDSGVQLTPTLQDDTVQVPPIMQQTPTPIPTPWEQTAQMPDPSIASQSAPLGDPNAVSEALGATDTTPTPSGAEIVQP